MSRLYPCVYCTEDGYCMKYSDEEVTSWCVQSPCKDEKPSNADRIRAMSDEELAEYINDVHYLLDEKPGMCDVCYHDSVQNCKECRLDWLREEVET